MNNTHSGTTFWRSLADQIRHAPVEMNDDDAFEIVHQLLQRSKDGNVEAKPTASYGLQHYLGNAIAEWVRRRHE